MNQRFWNPWTKGFGTHEPKVLVPLNQRFWYPWTKGFEKGGAEGPQHRYREMSGVLSYRLRAFGPHLSKGLGKFSLLSFFQNVFATHEPKVLQILFLFDCLFLCLLFFKRWREKFSLLCFYKKVFATHQQNILEFLFFIWISIFISSFF